MEGEQPEEVEIRLALHHPKEITVGPLIRLAQVLQMLLVVVGQVVLVWVRIITLALAAILALTIMEVLAEAEPHQVLVVLQ
jgi:hypothetical protein